MNKLQAYFSEIVNPIPWNKLDEQSLPNLTEKEVLQITRILPHKSNKFLLNHLDVVHKLAPERLMDIANDSDYVVASKLAHTLSPHMVQGNAQLLETLCSRLVHAHTISQDPLLTWHSRVNDHVALFSHKVPMLTADVLSSLSPAQLVSLINNANEATRGPILNAMDATLIQTYEPLIVETLKDASAKHEQKTLRAFVATLLHNDNHLALKQTPNLHEAITNTSIINLRPSYGRFGRRYARAFEALDTKLKTAGIKSFYTPITAKGPSQKLTASPLAPQ